jgi:hypothetical protein
VSIVHSIPFDVETDEHGPFPFVDAADAECPARAAVAGASPVGNPSSERRSGVSAERDSPALEAGRELPAFFDEERVEFLAIFEGKLEPGALDNSPGECLNVGNPVQRELPV